MKTCKGPLLAILLLCVYVIGCEKGQQIVGTAVEPPAEVVLMPDANLAAAVRETLGVAADAPITTEVLQNLRTLRLTDKGYRPIKDFTGLEYAVNLTELVMLGIHPLSDVSPLANLTKLTNLSFGDNRVSDISVLANLTNLKRFGISGSQVWDISVLANFTNLTELLLGNGLGDDIPLSGISVLANLTNLTELTLANLALSDVSVLANLMNLTKLEIAASDVSNISGLANLTNLTELRLWGTEVSDVSVLANLTNLTELRLELSQISDIAPLVANTGLGNGDIVVLLDNPLDKAATNTHIPALQARGVTVEW